MKLESDSGVGLTPELLYLIGACGAVNGRAVASAASAMRESLLVLPETRHDQEPSPVRETPPRLSTTVYLPSLTSLIY